MPVIHGSVGQARPLPIALPKKEAIMAEPAKRPFLIEKDPEGNFRLSLRTTRYNSQGYPLVTVERQAEIFKTATAAKTFARDNFNAKPGEYATK
jgi:hypothetical protein